MKLMRVIGTAFEAFDRPMWLQSYDPDGHSDGRGDIQFTDNRDHALVFDDAGAALECWRKVSTVRPLRPDGKPNRPLSAFTVEIEGK